MSNKITGNIEDRPPNPTDVSHLGQWVTAQDITSMSFNGSDIVNWADKSGFALDYSAIPLSQQPLYVPDGMNGLPTVRFNGTTNFMTSAFNLQHTVNPNITVFIVYQFYAIEAGLFGNDNGGWDRFMLSNRGSGNTNVGYEDSTGPMSYSSESPSTPHIARIEYTNTVNRVYIDGVLKDTNSVVTPGVGRTTTGLGAISSVGAQPLNGDISEMIIYKKILTSAEISLVEQDYINRIYNI